MKLRLKGNEENSLRLRVSRTDLERLAAGNSIEETVRLGAGHSLTYALRVGGDHMTITAEAGTIAVVVPGAAVARWSKQDEVGIYQTLRCEDGTLLQVVLEKDFACLDRSDADNGDTFAHPHAGATC